MSSIAINTRFLLQGKLEGMGFHIHEVLYRIVKDHPKVNFHFIFDRAWDPAYNDADNVRCYNAFPPARHPILQKWWYEYSLPRLLKKIKPDIFWSPDNFMSLRADVPTVMTIHDLAYLHVQEGVSSQDQKLYEKYTPLYVQKAKHILAVSEFTKQDIIKHFNKNPDDITVCYNGCRELFKPLNNSEIINVRNKYSGGSPYFLFLGSQHPRKNVHRLIEAFGRFKSTDSSPVKLIVAGRRAWMTEQIDRAIEQSHCRNEIIMIDRYLDGKEAADLVAASFCLVYPSLFEGFGIPILEGLQCEVPVITSSTSSMPEVGGDAAIYIDPYSIDSIVDALKLVTEDGVYRNQLISRAKVQKNKFSWDRTAEIIWHVLESELRAIMT